MRQDRRVAVIGLGYVGLPLAISFVEAGLIVEGIDAYPPRVAELNAGSSPIDDVSDERLAAALASGLSVVAPADAPHPRGRCDLRLRPDPDHHDQGPGPRPGPVGRRRRSATTSAPASWSILQSTTFPGTTTGPFREVLEQTGLKAGTDFDLAFAPERVNPGDPASASKGVPRLVGATTPEAHGARRGPPAAHQRPGRRAVLAGRRRARQAARERLPQRQHRVRQQARPAVRADGPRCLGGHQRRGDQAVRVHEVHARARASAATASRSIPYYLAWRAREFDFIDRFIELAGDINFAMPRHVVDLVGEALNDRGRALKGAKVGVLGVAFKPNVRDARNSPAADVLAGSRRPRRGRPVPRPARRDVQGREPVSPRGARRSTTSSTGPT